MKEVTPTELRANIYKLRDEILNTSISLEIKKGDKRLRTVPVKKSENSRIWSPDLRPSREIQVTWSISAGKVMRTVIYFDTLVALWLYAGLVAKLS